MTVPAARSPIPALRAELNGLSVYPAESGRGSLRRLDNNEGPPPPAAQLAEWLASFAESVSFYPEYGELSRTAGEAFGVDPACVMPVNGADEGVHLMLEAFTGPGRPLLVAPPTFSMYSIYAGQAGAPVLRAPQLPGFEPDLPTLLALLPQAALVALDSPNNPTGRRLPERTVRLVLERAEGLPVLVDETYGPCCGQDFAPLLAEYPNLILARSLSKVYGLAGLRVGFLLADPRLRRELERVRSPYNVAGPSAAVAVAALRGDTGWRQRIGAAVEARAGMQARLRAAGMFTSPSDTHFCLVNLGGLAPEAARILRNAGILVRDLGAALPGNLRISVAGEEDARALLAVLLPWWARRTQEGGAA